MYNSIFTCVLVIFIRSAQIQEKADLKIAFNNLNKRLWKLVPTVVVLNAETVRMTLIFLKQLLFYL